MFPGHMFSPKQKIISLKEETTTSIHLSSPLFLELALIIVKN